jgi:hypothetical protein
MNPPNKYIYGYRFIKEQGPEEDWDYVIQAHRNQNGLHYDLRLAKPSNPYAFSWASRKYPGEGIDPILLRRTHDHAIQHLDFEGPLITAKGKGTVKKIKRGKAKIHLISQEKGLIFQTDGGEKYKLKNIKGKKYLIKREE